MEKKIIIIAGLIAALAGPLLFSKFNRGQLNITTAPPGAAVFINDEDSGKTPTEIKLKQGQYELRITNDGYRTVKQIIKIRTRKRTSLDLALEPMKKDDQPEK